jgi:hypothetical protein
MVDKTELWQIVTNIQEKLNYGHLNCNRRMQEETLRTPDYVPMLTKELSSVLLVAFRLLIVVEGGGGGGGGFLHGKKVDGGGPGSTGGVYG